VEKIKGDLFQPPYMPLCGPGYRRWCSDLWRARRSVDRIPVAASFSRLVCIRHGAHPSSDTMTTELLPKVNWPGCGVNQAPPTNTNKQTMLNLWRERKPTRCNNQMFIINFCLNMFRASLSPSSGEQRPCVTAYGVLRWFCWMWLVAVVGRCVVGCEHCEGSPTSQCSHPTTQRPTTATNHIQQNQRSTPYTVTHGLCSPEDRPNDARNMLRQKLIINIWLLHLVGFLSLHTLLTMHGHRNLKYAKSVHSHT